MKTPMINRDTLLSLTNVSKFLNIERGSYKEGWNDAIDKMAKLINDCPAVEVEERGK